MRRWHINNSSIGKQLHLFFLNKYHWNPVSYCLQSKGYILWGWRFFISVILFLPLYSKPATVLWNAVLCRHSQKGQTFYKVSLLIWNKSKITKNIIDRSLTWILLKAMQKQRNEVIVLKVLHCTAMTLLNIDNFLHSFMGVPA